MLRHRGIFNLKHCLFAHTALFCCTKNLKLLVEAVVLVSNLRRMRNILETTLSGCYKYSTSGFWYWTAGQRIDPSRCSTFIWRVTSTNTYNDTVSTMTYTNWYSLEPDCGRGQTEKCMNLYSRHSYKWNDLSCSSEVCSVCELDI